MISIWQARHIWSFFALFNFNNIFINKFCVLNFLNMYYTRRQQKSFNAMVKEKENAVFCKALRTWICDHYFLQSPLRYVMYLYGLWLLVIWAKEIVLFDLTGWWTFLQCFKICDQINACCLLLCLFILRNSMKSRLSSYVSWGENSQLLAYIEYSLYFCAKQILKFTSPQPRLSSNIRTVALRMNEYLKKKWFPVSSVQSKTTFWAGSQVYIQIWSTWRRG